MSDHDEHAVKLAGQKKFHRLQPDAVLGTLRCGAGQRGTRQARWKPVDDVLESQRCGECWVKAAADLGEPVQGSSA